MTTKKEGPFRRFAKAVQEIRKRPLDPKAVEEFNRGVERTEKSKKDEKVETPRKIARSPEADL